MIAALAAHEAGQTVLVIEADAIASGSTALSAGLIPAAGTVIQKYEGIKDSAGLFAKDIQKKAHGENDPELETALAHGAAEVIDWLSDTHSMPFSVVTDFDYPGHSRRRMHGLPSRSGAELVNVLRSACENQGIEIICGMRAATLYAAKRRVTGVGALRPNGSQENIGCQKLVLACNGFGGNRLMVAQNMPDIKEAVWFGHDGNRGEAVHWGRALGAEIRHIGAYQGHGNVAHPHGILITWAVITEGGVQVNLEGDRFWDESQGYSEAARAVLSQPDGVAYAIFDERIAGIARQFEDFREAERQGAIIEAGSLEQLAQALNLPPDRLSKTMQNLPDKGSDEFGRLFDGRSLNPPYRAVRVTGALFHTQGGLLTDGEGRVLHSDGTCFENLFRKPVSKTCLPEAGPPVVCLDHRTAVICQATDC